MLSEGQAHVHGMTTRTNRRRIPTRLLFFFFLTVLFGAGCSLPQQPGDWSWDTHLTVPLGARTYGMWDLQDSQQHIREHGSGVGMNSDSSMYYAAFQELRVGFLDSLAMDPHQYGLVKPITALFVPLNVQRTDLYSLGQMNSGIAALHGQTTEVPSHPLWATSTLNFGGAIDSFTVDTGTVAITVTNTLPYAVSSLELKLDNGMGSRYALVSNAQLAAGEQLSRNVTMSGFHLAQAATLSLTATGEGGSSIHVDSTQGLIVTTRIDTVQANQYTGIIPPQTLYADTMQDVNQRHRLYLGIIDSGTVYVTAVNQTMVDDTIWIVFPSLITPLGDSLVSRQFVPAGESATDTIDVRGYRMRLPNETPQRAELRLYSSSPASPSRQTFVPGEEQVSGILSTSRLAFSYFQGVLNNLELQFPVETTTIERPPEGWDAVHPTTVDAYVHILSGLDAMASTTLDVETYLNGATIAGRHFNIPDIVLNSDSTVVFTGLADLLNQYPDSMRSLGQIAVNGPVAMYETETIGIELELRAPLTFTLEPVHAPGDVERVETGDIEEIQSATARIRIWNRLPVGGYAYLIAARDSTDVLPASTAAVDTVAQSAFPVSSIEDGRATGEAYTEFTVTLSDSVLEFLRHPPFYTRLDLALPGSDGDTLIAHGSDYVKVQIIADIIYQIRTGGEL